MERPVVSLRRLTYRPDGMVHYQGTKFHPRLGIDHQLVTPVEFLACLVPHVLLKYEVTLRSYGAVSTTLRRRAGWLQRPPVDAPPRLAVAIAPDSPGVDPESIPSPPSAATPAAPPAAPLPLPANAPEDSEFLRRRKRGWAKLIAKTWKDDPGICKGCGQPMKIIAAIGPEQEAVIERILRHLHRWDPPWSRLRKARGPPRGAQGAAPPRAQGSARGPTETIDPVIDDELYSLDPSPPEDG
jgi:hypothetical protein